MDFSWVNWPTALTLWGGSADQLLEQLQKVQNKAARAVTKSDWHTPARLLLKQCGWLSVKQLVVYHSTMLMFKVMMTESPRYLFSMFSSKYHCDTRHARSKQVKPTRGSTLDLSEESFRWRAAKIYNELPVSLRQSTSAGSFRVGLKKWIRDNIPVN